MRTNAVVLTLFAIVSPALSAQMLVPVTDLAREADVVIVGAVSKIAEAGGTTTANVTLEVQVMGAIKGQPLAQTLQVYTPSKTPGAIGPITADPSMTGQTGVWFLKAEAGRFRILLRHKRAHSASDLFLPVTASAGSSFTGASPPLETQVLAYHVQWYRSLSSPTSAEDSMFLSSFENWHTGSVSPEVTWASVEPLLSSPSSTQRIVGLTAAIRRGALGGLEVLARELDTLRDDPKFSLIVTAIERYPKDQSWVEPLVRLIGKQPAIAGLDAAIASALRKIGTRSVVPGIVALLDSADPQAQLAAASFFGVYTLFADSSGDVRADGLVGPLATAETKAFTPRKDSPMTAAQYAQFWKNWWSENRGRIGFPVR